MTDSRARIDPRYDPRFQRGYVGGDAGDPPHADSPTPTSPVVAPVPITREPREQLEGPPSTAVLERLAQPNHDDVARRRPTAETSPAGDTAAASPHESTGEAAAVEEAGAPAATEQPDGGAVGAWESDSELDRRARAWLLAGWLLSAAITAGGLWWAWSAATDPNYYNGNGPGGDNAFLFLQWAVPPAMVMIGVLGAVVVTTLAGVHQLAASADRHAARAESAFPRVPAAFALIGIALAGAIAVIWMGGLIADSQDVMWTGTGPAADDVNTLALSRVGEVGIGPFASAAFAAVIGLAVLGVQSARPIRRTGGRAR